MPIKREFTVNSLIEFIKDFQNHNTFSKSIKEWIEKKEKETGRKIDELLYGDIYEYIDSEDLELEEILENTEGKFFLEYNDYNEKFYIYEFV